MALTDDEKQEILELYGRGYSHRKIADRALKSETTIRKVIKEAAEKVIKLRAEELEEDQIADRTNYPLTFVRRILKNRENNQDEILEAEVEPEAEVEISKAPKKVDIEADWSDFQKSVEIEQRKERLRKGAIESIEALEQMIAYFRDEGVLDEAYKERHGSMKKKLQEFVLVKLIEVHSIENVHTLETISEENDEEISALFDEYDKKESESRKARKAREKARSDELLNRKIDIPMYPEFVREEIKERFLVKNLEEASIVSDALTQVALIIMKANGFKLEHNDKTWKGFMSTIREGGWDYLEKMAKEYRSDTERALVSINVCPECESKLTRKHVEGKTIVSCSSCGKAYEILDK